VPKFLAIEVNAYLMGSFADSPRTVRIGPIRLAPAVVPAPMSGVTDRPFRDLMRRFGAGLVVSEMTASRELLHAARTGRGGGPEPVDPAPSSVQLAGHDPAVMAEAAKLAADRGASLIDINFGCPAKKVVNKLAGSALMREEALAARIMAAVVGAVDVPVTVKMRTGWDDADRNAPRFARLAEEAGVQLVAVHGRTRCQLYTGRADWAFIRRVKAAVSIPVLANGDIDGYDAVDRCLAESGADGVMIGRAVQGRPWLVGDVARYLTTGERRADPPISEKRAIVLEHYEALLGHYGIRRGVRIARKHLGWYARGLRDAAAFRAAVNAEDGPAAVRNLIRRAFAADADLAASAPAAVREAA